MLDNWILFRCTGVVGGCVMGLLVGVTPAVGADPVSVQVLREGGVVKARWTSDSVTLGAPFIHPGFIVERSSNLTDWEVMGNRRPTGSGMDGTRRFWVIWTGTVGWT